MVWRGTDQPGRLYVSPCQWFLGVDTPPPTHTHTQKLSNYVLLSTGPPLTSSSQKASAVWSTEGVRVPYSKKDWDLAQTVPPFHHHHPPPTQKKKKEAEVNLLWQKTCHLRLLYACQNHKQHHVHHLLKAYDHNTQLKLDRVRSDYKNTTFSVSLSLNSDAAATLKCRQGH